MRKLLLTLLLLCPVPAFAQTHECSLPIQVNPQVPANFIAVVCWAGRDSQGLTLDPATVTVQLTIDGQTRPAVALPAPTGTGTGTGGARAYYFPASVTSAGNHNWTATLISPGGQFTTSPFAFVVSAGAPAGAVGQATKPQP